ncbi:hypothetical protein [Rubritalea tangerina]
MSNHYPYAYFIKFSSGKSWAGMMSGGIQKHSKISQWSSKQKGGTRAA